MAGVSTIDDEVKSNTLIIKSCLLTKIQIDNAIERVSDEECKMFRNVACFHNKNNYGVKLEIRK